LKHKKTDTDHNRTKRDAIENTETLAPRVTVEKPFLLSDGSVVFLEHFGVTKNWIALEDSYSKTGASLASTVVCNSNTPEDRNVFAIYVSYYVKVKLTLSTMGGEVSVKLPFTLTHSCINEAPTDSVIEEATHKMILEAKEDERDSDEEDGRGETIIKNDEKENTFHNQDKSPEEQKCITNVVVNIETTSRRPLKMPITVPKDTPIVRSNDEELSVIEKCPVDS
ncbi:unnamed protein product, partial [Leptidea sinapis]